MDSDIWDDDGWEDMPVIRSNEYETSVSLFDSDPRSDRDSKNRTRANAPVPARIVEPEGSSHGYATMAGGTATGNATGRLIETGEEGAKSGLREKEELDEMDYTRLELDDDPDEDDISMRTQYLFNEDTSMTPLSQMQQTKTLLTEGQRIAYVGLCRLVAREMVQTLALAAKGAKELEPARESCQHWANKIMGRLYRHMDVNSAGTSRSSPALGRPDTDLTSNRTTYDRAARRTRRHLGRPRPLPGGDLHNGQPRVRPGRSGRGRTRSRYRRDSQ